MKRGTEHEFICAEFFSVLITFAFVTTLIWEWKNTAALAEFNKPTVLIHHHELQCYSCTVSHTDVCTHTSIKWRVGYPAVKSTAEYGVLPFGEGEIHWSLSPNIKESIDAISHKDCCETYRQRRITHRREIWPQWLLSHTCFFHWIESGPNCQFDHWLAHTLYGVHYKEDSLRGISDTTRM